MGAAPRPTPNGSGRTSPENAAIELRDPPEVAAPLLLLQATKRTGWIRPPQQFYRARRLDHEA